MMALVAVKPVDINVKGTWVERHDKATGRWEWFQWDG